MPPVLPRPGVRFEVRFDDLSFQEDIGRATKRGREVAIEARNRLRREGADPSVLRCQEEHREEPSSQTASSCTCLLRTAGGGWCSSSSAIGQAASWCSPTSHLLSGIPIRAADPMFIVGLTPACIKRATTIAENRPERNRLLVVAVLAWSISGRDACCPKRAAQVTA
jgi:hypothetical protein